MSAAVTRLVRTEAKLFLREPVSLLFVLAFPVLVVVILGGVFEPDDAGFGGATPSDYYIAAYVGVVLAAVGLVTLPAHLAGYRERGVLRRFQASHFPPWALPAAWAVVATMLSILGFAVLLATAHLTYGIPPIDDPAGTLVAVSLATLTYVSVGILLGLLLPTARAAQGVGFALFFPSFLLGGGGPPPDAMPETMRSIAKVFPMTHVVQAIQRPWLSIGPSANGALLLLAVLLVAATCGWLLLSRRVGDR